MAGSNEIPLGKSTEYSFTYKPDVLFPIPRAQGRDALAIQGDIPFTGYDRWTAYELSWLNSLGMPQVAIAEFDFPCTAANLVESKSFKLYLNSLNHTAFENTDKLLATMQDDLSAVAGADVVIRLFPVDDYPRQSSQGFVCLDQQAVACKQYQPDASLLRQQSEVVEEQLCSHLFRSLCPVTSQPDWASVYLVYKGKQLDHQALLQYIISFRDHQGFHEQCVEHMFMDLQTHCQFESLTVYARFMRRGGLDINPLRSSSQNIPAMLCQARQ